jgi:hypothetical protein
VLSDIVSLLLLVVAILTLFVNIGRNKQQKKDDKDKKE